MIRITQLVALVIFALTVTLEADDSGKVAIREEIQAVIEEGHYPGISILLIHRGEVIMREAHGVVDIETKEPFTTDQLCWLASTGKIFTATLMAKLVDEDVLSFDDPIAQAFPRFSKITLREDSASPKQPILLRHALSHTSGLPGNQWMKENGITEGDPQHADYFLAKTPDDFIDGCLKMGLAVEPGARMLYGRPIDLSACVSEKLTGKPFTQLMEEKIFAPLGLKNTTIQPTKEDLENLAPLYQSDTPGVFEPDTFGLEVADRQANRLSTAGGGVYSTLDDLGVLMLLHLNHGKHEGVQLVDADTLQKLYEPQPGTNGRYGLAFQIMKSKINGESTLYNHPGYSGPVAWFDFERQLAGVLLMQSNTVGRGKHHLRIIDRIHKMIPASEKPIAKASPQPQSPSEEVLADHQFELVFDSAFTDESVIGPESPLWRRETMTGSNNSGQHRQAPARRHAAWYDQHGDKTAFIRDGLLVQRGFVADSDIPDFVSRDAGDAPRNHEYIDPDPRDKTGGAVNFADFEIHTSWFDTFALKSEKGNQVPVLATDAQVPDGKYWGQSGKTDTKSPNITFSPGTYFEIEVNFEDMRALGHRHSFWLMPASSGGKAYDNDPANGLEIDIYEHELAWEKGTHNGDGRNLNEAMLMKCIGGTTTPPSTENELREDGQTLIYVPGINTGWHHIGLLWTKDELVWFIDGTPRVRDTTLVPQVEMFLILSREANTGATKSEEPTSLKMDGKRIPHDAGLMGRNVATPRNRELIKAGKDDVKVRAVRVWKIVE